ncbi:hypothetical protein E4T56_gene11269 [Termitomyces sp. T112]|nr:hypothetical protein E4T56_gene11269 [Termitomyces sp. T112]
MVEAAPDVKEEPKQNGDHEAVAKVEKALDPPKVNGSEIPANATNGDVTNKKRSRTDVDQEAQNMVIHSLRLQVQDLFSQVNELNSKLVKSYDRVSDLEDDLHVASEANRSSSLKISQLELEREQHLSALNTGILVEKSQVTAELTRLMEKATEEAAHRGQAESARQAIEKDLDDLSATLFGQANTMVAEARIARHESEQKVQVAERNLKSAEEAVSAMQQQIQLLRAEKEEAEEVAETSQAVLDMTVGKGMDKRSSKNPTPSLRLLSSHPPYQEFLLFVAHLRSVHSSSLQPPTVSSLLPQPFLARLLTEDSEPTIRLDLAPSLNWLSRRSVLAAIHNGQLIIEPMSSTAFLQEVIPSGSMNNGNISCALCGTSIFSTPTTSNDTIIPLPPILTQSNSGTTSWSASLFKKPSATNHSISTNNITPSTPSHNGSSSQASPSQVYIFKLAIPSSAMSSLPIPSLPRTSNSSTSPSPLPTLTHTDSHSYASSANPQQFSTIYPLCMNNWCLFRLRSTCSLWAFVRSGVIEKIWEEEVPAYPTKTVSSTGEKPPIPPRRRGLWSMASALSERAASWGEGDKDKAKKVKAAEKTPSSTTPTLEPKLNRRRLPPLLPPKATLATTTPTVASTPVKSAIPPPLPKRSEVRQASPPVVPGPTVPPAAPTDKPVEISANLFTTEVKQETPAAPLSTTDTPSEPSAAKESSNAQVEIPTASATTPTPAGTAAPAAQEPKLPPRPPRRPMNLESHPQTLLVANAAFATPGTPAPPPLPRRAVTRASRVPTDDAVPSRSPTPARPITEYNAEDAAQTSKKEGSEQASSPVADAVPPVKEGTKEEKPAAAEANKLALVSPSVKEGVFVDVESASESEKEEGKAEKEVEGQDKAGLPEGGKEAQQKVEDKEDKVEVKAVDKVEEKADTVQNVEKTKVEEKADKAEKVKAKADKIEKTEAKKVEGKADKAEETTKVNETKTDEKTNEKTETSTGSEMTVPLSDAQTTDKEDTRKDVDNNTKIPDDDPESSGNYVGNVTWEERTWKEIIRLKEAMFWARIGGSKQ